MKDKIDKLTNEINEMKLKEIVDKENINALTNLRTTLNDFFSIVRVNQK